MTKKGFQIFSAISLFLCAFFLSGNISAQNLPEDAPILISQNDSTRALAINQTRGQQATLNKIFSPGGNTTITFFVTNLDLLANDDKRAFRADLQDANRKRYSLEVVSFDPLPDRPWVYALKARLNERIGNVGDALVRVNFRGVASNRVRISIGFEGGTIQDDAGSLPTPMPDSPVLRINKRSFAPVPWTGDSVRFMEQATFAPRAETEANIRRMGIAAWITEQMEEKRDANGAIRYSSIPYPNLPLQQTAPPTTCTGNCLRDNYTMFPLQNWFYKEAVYGEDQQLRRRVSWALHQIWVVSGRETVQPSRMLPYIQTLDRNAFGNYRDLMREMTLNPAMGNYLDMAISTRQNPNENFAREVLQLFSIGVDMLNQDGTPMLDASGNRIPAYDQNAVNNFTKTLTGWNFCNQGCPNSQPGIVNYFDPLIPIPVNHDTGAKTLLNYSGANPAVPEGQTPEQDLDDAINNIFNHPNVAPFVSKLLIQQFVTSNPTPAYVGRVSAVFRNNGSSVRGDIKAVIRAILLDPEARGNIKTDPDYGKLREPVLFATNVLRPFVPSSNRYAGSWCGGQSDGVLNFLTEPLGQDVFNPPSVFNYYPMDYVISNVGLAGPEFGTLSTNTILKRANFVEKFFPALPGSGTASGIQVNGQIVSTPGNVPIPNPEYSLCGMEVYIPRLQALSASDATGALLVDTLNKEMLRSSMSGAMRGDILTAVRAVDPNNTLRRARTAIYLIATSPQFQVQR